MIKLYDQVNYLRKNSPWLFFTILVYGVAFLYLFIQNFILSSSVDLLNFRNVDDLAFQQYLRGAHENFQFLNLNGYAYGWMFWFPLVIITYPFYFLSINFGIDGPLIVIPRLMSLLFVFGTAFNLFKIASIYTKDSFLKSIILLLFLSFPSTGYFSITFGTAAQVMFFSSLTFYCTARKIALTKKDLALIAVLMAMTAATKLNGLLILPVVSLLIADRLYWRVNRQNLINAIYFISILFMSIVFLSQMEISVVLNQIEKTQTNYGNELSLQNLLLDGIVSKTLHPFIFIAMLFGILVQCLKQRQENRPRQRDFIYILFTFVLSIIYLVLTIKMGAFFMVVYFTAVSFLLVLGVLPLEYLCKKFKYILGVLILIINIVGNWHQIVLSKDNISNSVFWNSYYKKSQDKKIKEQLLSQKILQQKLGSPDSYKNGLCILREKQVPLIYSSLKQNVACDIRVYSNLEEVLNRKWLVKVYDVIAIYKKGIAFLNEDEFTKLTESADNNIALQYKKHRDLVQEFVETKTLKNVKYDIFFEEGDVIYFKKRQD
ncbi:MAG: hypothetical protein P8P83_03010 [Rickettsiaceae bacterium]|nr:hypothetical protein [Rickettsiaceae bacterium]